MRGHQRRADFNRAALAEPDAAPEAHVLVGRRGIPIDPVDAQVFLGLRDGFNGQHVRPVAHQQRRDVEFVGAIRAGNFARVCDALAVEPDVGAIVDAIEIQPHALAIRTIRRAEFGAVPPRAAERAVLRHGQHGKHFADGIRSSRNRTQVFAEIGIGERFVRHERGNNG